MYHAINICGWLPSSQVLCVELFKTHRCCAQQESKLTLLSGFPCLDNSTSRLESTSTSAPAVACTMANVYTQLLPPPKARWGVADIPDLTGKVMIVTGGNAGIGRETVKALLLHNAKVYMASRNEEKALAAITQLERETGRRAIFLKLDLANLSSVKAAAQEFMSKETKLHVLFNNGGVTYPPRGTIDSGWI
ncbi:hypothetical protein ONZ51_g3428 [Trametes cubensis]|uniref:NAD(P)-binding protein n=1 Tax=Trametes cubensis TaxID=1111947 RepID=A0AAD7U065_9APHY|nr:hypothetical protein ONZ51_g3428 [Trametes cubensis]